MLRETWQSKLRGQTDGGHMLMKSHHAFEVPQHAEMPQQRCRSRDASVNSHGSIAVDHGFDYC